MRTQDLVGVLGRHAQPVDPHAADRQLMLYLGLGAAMSVVAALAFFGVRADLRAAAADPAFWLKAAFPASVALGALATLWRLGFPGVRLGLAPAALAAPVLLALASAGFALWRAPAAERAAQLFGTTWWACVAAIASLAAPAALCAFLALRRLAPTRPVLTGAVAGAFAGGVAASAYSLYCTVMQAPYVGAWYTAGMLLAAGAGAVAGSRWLRW